ncbi:MAG: archaetidylserine decarboxylase [Bdellovibrionota bacterium]
MKARLLYWIFLFVPKNHLSFIVGKVANIKSPKFLVRLITKCFIKFYKINTDEVAKDIKDFKSLGEFFNRDLKAGARPLQGDFVSPVDARLRNAEKLDKLSLEVVKGKSYDLAKFIGSDEDVKKFDGGYFINLYLSPKDYHNVHSPVSGVISGVRYIPGKLWPVTDWSLNTVEDLFSINERLVFDIESEFGEMFLVMVGATNVGKMSSKFLDFKTNNLNARVARDFPIGREVSIMEKIGCI